MLAAEQIIVVGSAFPAAAAAASFGTPTTLGTATANGTAIVLTVTADVPVGALIVVCVADANISGTTGTQACADSVNGAHTLGPNANNNNSAANGFGSLFYFWNSGAITSGVGTITYTPVNLTGLRVLSAFYVTGALTSGNPGEASATATGSSTTPSVTSGAPTAAGELIVGVVTHAGSGSFTQDSANAAYATPPVRIASSGSAAVVAGGSVVNSGGSALAFAPTLGTSRAWAALVIAFKKAA